MKGLVKPSRNGYLYWLELFGRPDQLRRRDQLREAGRVREHRPDERAAELQRRARARHRQVRRVLPVAVGWQGLAAEAYNPNTGMIYIPANENHCGSLEGKVQEYVAGQWWTGVDIPDIGFTIDQNADHYAVSSRPGTSTRAKSGCASIRRR